MVKDYFNEFVHIRKQLKPAVEKQVPQVSFDSKWVEDHARSNISQEEFENTLYDLENKGKLKWNEFRELNKKFKNIRRQMEEEKQKVLLKYNSNWVERKAITNITEYDFIELLNELEDRKEISRARLREIMK